MAYRTKGALDPLLLKTSLVPAPDDGSTLSVSANEKHVTVSASYDSETALLLAFMVRIRTRRSFAATGTSGLCVRLSNSDEIGNKRQINSSFELTSLRFPLSN
jgi:hypothetical protein